MTLSKKRMNELKDTFKNVMSVEATQYLSKLNLGKIMVDHNMMTADEYNSVAGELNFKLDIVENTEKTK